MGGSNTALAVSLAALVVLAGCGGRTHPEPDAGANPDATSPCGDCDDDVPCTRDSCTEGACAHESDDSQCESESPCLVPECDPHAGCVVDALPDGTWCGAPGSDGAPPPVCEAGDCLPQRVVGVRSWATIRIETSEPTSEYGHFTHLARVSDRDGDGVDDVAAWVGSWDEGGSLDVSPGGVGLYSFPSGRTLWQLEPEAGEMRLGYALLCPGDLDGDGATDLVFRLEREEQGAVRAVDAGDGHALWETAASRGWLYSIADLDGDSAGDLAWVEWSDLNGFESLRFVSANSGGDLGALYPTPGVTRGYYDVVSAGDADGDSVPDIAVETWTDFHSYVEVFSGADLETIGLYDPPAENTFPVLSLGDLTGDGLQEIAVGDYDNGLPSYSAADLWEGAALWVIPPSGLLISQRTYDLDADGHPDITASQRQDGQHVRSWRSAMDGRVLFAAANVDEAGSPVALQRQDVQVPDVNGDGAEDWVIALEDDPGLLLVLASELEIARENE